MRLTIKCTHVTETLLSTMPRTCWSDWREPTAGTPLWKAVLDTAHAPPLRLPVPLAEEWQLLSLSHFLRAADTRKRVTASRRSRLPAGTGVHWDVGRRTSHPLSSEQLGSAQLRCHMAMDLPRQHSPLRWAKTMDAAWIRFLNLPSSPLPTALSCLITLESLPLSKESQVVGYFPSHCLSSKLKKHTFPSVYVAFRVY